MKSLGAGKSVWNSKKKAIRRAIERSWTRELDWSHRLRPKVQKFSIKTFRRPTLKQHCLSRLSKCKCFQNSQSKSKPPSLPSCRRSTKPPFLRKTKRSEAPSTGLQAAKKTATHSQESRNQTKPLRSKARVISQQQQLAKHINKTPPCSIGPQREPDLATLIIFRHRNKVSLERARLSLWSKVGETQRSQ